MLSTLKYMCDRSESNISSSLAAMARGCGMTANQCLVVRNKRLKALLTIKPVILSNGKVHSSVANHMDAVESWIR